MTDVLNGCLDLLAKSVLLIVVAAGISVAARRRAAAVRHFIWATTLGCLLLMPLFQFLAPVRPQLAATALTIPVAPHATAPFLEGRVGEMSNPAAPFLDGRAGERSNPASWHERTPNDLLLCAYLAVAGLLLIRLIVTQVSARRIVALGRTSVDNSLTAIVIHWSKRYRVKRRVEIAFLESAQVPMLLGMSRPAILLPPGAADWPETRLTNSVAHELAHVVRWDLLWQALAGLACAVYWINPMVWMAAARLRIESENACDDLVLDRGVDAAEYAATLVDIARDLRRSVPAPALSMVHSSQIEERVRSIVDCHRRRGSMLLSVVIGLSLATGIAAAVVGNYHFAGYDHRLIVGDQAYDLPSNIITTRQRSIVLPDGTTLRVKRVFYGTASPQRAIKWGYRLVTIGSNEPSRLREGLHPILLMCMEEPGSNNFEQPLYAVNGEIVVNSRLGSDVFCAAGYGEWRTVKAIPIDSIRTTPSSGYRQYACRAEGNGRGMESEPMSILRVPKIDYHSIGPGEMTVGSVLIDVPPANPSDMDSVSRSILGERASLVISSTPRIDYYAPIPGQPYFIQSVTLTYPMGNSNAYQWMDQRYVAIDDHGRCTQLEPETVGNAGDSIGISSDPHFFYKRCNPIDWNHVREIDFQTRPYAFVLFKDLTPDAPSNTRRHFYPRDATAHAQ